MASNVQFAPDCFIAQSSATAIRGQITIGAGTVIHPAVTIIAEGGPIIIGDNNLIEEQTVIINKSTGSVLVIGNGNVFEVGSRVESSTIGDDNVIEAKAVVGPQAVIGNNCRIGAMCTVSPNEFLADNTVVFGRENTQRVDPTMTKPSAYTEQLAYLKKIMPSFHTMYQQA
eukprot:m.235302 g.235302  ORF g.235302 m.235302 type:complete len:171 (+) comp12799_c0_seq1:149-661(+)